MTTSRAIDFRTVELIKDKKVTTIVTALKQVIDMYQARGFKTPHLSQCAIRTYKKKC